MNKVLKKKYSTVVEWYRKATEQGHAYAQSNLGHLIKKVVFE